MSNGALKGSLARIVMVKVKVFYCVFVKKKAKENPAELKRFRGGSPVSTTAIKLMRQIL